MNKLTLIKVGGTNGYRPSPQDLEYWRSCFKDGIMDPDEVERHGITVEHLDLKEDQDYVTLVRVGSEDYKPTKEDLEAWRQVFEEAQKDPDFKIFTHAEVHVEQVKLGKSTKVIIGDAVVVD